MTLCHGSTHSAKLSSHQSGPNTENLFSQQLISETITPRHTIIQEHRVKNSAGRARGARLLLLMSFSD